MNADDTIIKKEEFKLYTFKDDIRKIEVEIHNESSMIYKGCIVHWVNWNNDSVRYNWQPVDDEPEFRWNEDCEKHVGDVFIAIDRYRKNHPLKEPKQ